MRVDYRVVVEEREAVKVKYRALMDQLEGERTELETVIQQLNQVQERMVADSRERVALSDQVSELQEELERRSNAEKQLFDTKTLLIEKNMQVENLGKKVDTYSLKLQELKAVVGGLQTELQASKALESTRIIELDNNTKTINELNDTIFVLDGDLGRSKAELERLLTELNTTKEERVVLEKEVKKLASYSQELREEVEEKKGLLERLREEAEQKDGLLEELKATNISLHERTEALGQLASDQSLVITGLEAEVQEVRAEGRRAGQQQRILEDRAEILRIDIEHRDQKIRSLQAGGIFYTN